MKKFIYTIILLLFLSFEASADLRWVETASKHNPRMGHAAGAHEGRIYVFGGIRSARREMLTSVEVFIPERQGWSEVEPLPAPLYQAAAVSYGRNILIIGGLTSNGNFNNRIYLYNPDNDTFLVATRMPEPYLYGHGAVRVGRRILIVGGTTGPQQYEGRGRLFNPDSLTWIEAHSLDSPRANFSLSERNDTIWAVGGFNLGGPLNGMEALRERGWVNVEPMPTARGGLGAAFLRDMLIAAGGRTREGGRSVTNLVEGYLPHDDEWIERELPAMISPRMDFALIELNDTLYAIGGRGQRVAAVMNSVEILYDDDTTDVVDYADNPLIAIPVTIYPNPTNGPVTFHFPPGPASIKLLDINGRSIAQIPIPSACSTWIWNSSPHPAGAYIYEYIPLSGKDPQQGRIVVVK